MMTSKKSGLIAAELVNYPNRRRYSKRRAGTVKTSAGTVSAAPAAYNTHWKRAGGACQYTGLLYRESGNSGEVTDARNGRTTAAEGYRLRRVEGDRTELTGCTIFTLHGALIGTPGEMSPKKGETTPGSVDTRSSAGTRQGSPDRS
jgi:hypothetical protein